MMWHSNIIKSRYVTVIDEDGNPKNNNITHYSSKVNSLLYNLAVSTPVQPLYNPSKQKPVKAEEDNPKEVNEIIDGIVDVNAMKSVDELIRELTGKD